MRADFSDIALAIFMIAIVALIVILMGVIIYETVKEKPDIYPVCSTIDLWEIGDTDYIRMTEQESAEYCK